MRRIPKKEAYLTQSQKTRRFPLLTLIILSAAAAGLFLYPDNRAVIILTLAIAALLLIVFGERFALDEALEARGIPGREALFPLIALGLSLWLGAVSPATIRTVFLGKVDIIVFILSFAIVAEGIARSGYFAFAANKIVAKCQGNTSRLIIYLYILSSLLAFLTSNDIVILVLTPVILSICVHARIGNTRLLLMSQFVAANTMSMGTLIGSPTNIIFGYALNMSFFGYLFMMILPTLLSGILSLILVEWINQQSRPGSGGMFAGRWSYDETYRVPASARYTRFTAPMKTWLILFALAVTLSAVVSSFHSSLLYAALPIAMVSLLTLYRAKHQETGDEKAARRDLMQVMQFLPYGIFFFGMTYFTFSAELAQLNVTQNVILPWIRAHLLNDVVHASFGMVLISGALTNTINDLPASALLSDILLHLNMQGSALNEYLQFVVMQAIMVGLNIGCYVTPIGALAGLMWFNLIRREERRQHRREIEAEAARTAPPLKLLTPSRCDLIRYGCMHFAFVSFFLGYLLPFFVHIIDMLVSSPSLANETAMPNLISIRQYLPYIGLGLLAFIFIATRRVLIRSGVLLGHMREVFVVMTRVTIWTMKNRLLYLVTLGSLLLAAASGLLYWAETTHERIYGSAEGSKALFDSLSSFFIWAMVFSGAGLSDAYKPHSALGMALTSILPVLVIGGIVMIAQLSSKKTIQQLAERMATGDIPGYRIVVVNFQSNYESFVETMLHNRAATVLLLCESDSLARAQSFCARLDMVEDTSCRAYAALKMADAAYCIQEYRIDQADEIYLLSDMTVQGEYDKIRYAAKLDTALGSIHAALTEGTPGGAGAQIPDIEELEGIPKIFVETCSERFYNLIVKASSPLFLRTTIHTTFDRDITDLLMADIDESLASLNQYYHLGSHRAPHLFRDGASPLTASVLREFDLDAKGRELFRAHFSGPDGYERIRTADGMANAPTLQQSAASVRSSVAEKTHGAQYIDAQGQSCLIDSADLFGVIADVGNTPIHLSIPSASLSLQEVLIDKVILRQSSMDGKADAPALARSLQRSASRIFIFNLSPLAQTFIRTLLPYFTDAKTPRIVLMCDSRQFVPDALRNDPRIHLMQSAHIEELVQQICPGLADRAGQGEGAQKFSPVLFKGDRLYGFLEHEGDNAEARSIDFIDRLDTSLQQLAREALAAGHPAPITHPEVYIAMEALGPDSKFMLENFYIDKIIDASMPRLSYVEILAKIFHRVLSDKSLGAEIRPNVFNFRRAAEIAQYLCHFSVAFAEDVRLKDTVGTEIRLPGKTMREAVSDMRAWSMPPLQLYARLRVEAVAHKESRMGSYTFRLAQVPESEPIRKGDLLLNLPVI